MLGKSLYIFTSKIIGYGLRLLLPMVLARLLTQSDFGAYRQFFLLELLIALLFQFGVNQSLFYFIPRDGKNAGSYLLNSIVLNVAIYAAVFIGLGLFRSPLSLQLKMPILDSHFWYLAVYTMLIMLTMAADSYLIARQKVKQSAAFEIVGQLIATIATLVAAFATRSLDAIITALVLSRFLHMLIMFGYVQIRLRGFAAENYFTNIWRQVKYGVVLGLGGTFWMLLSRLHEVIVSSRYGPELFAVYSVGCTHMQVMHFYMYSLIVVSLGRFAQMEKSGDRGGMRELWREVLTSLYAIIVPIVVLLLLISKPLIILMFSARYVDAVPIFQVNLLTSFSMLWNAALVLRAMNRNDVTFYLHLALLVVAPFVLYGAMNAYGMVGIMAGQVLLLVGGRLLALVLVNRISGLRLDYVVGVRGILAFYKQGVINVKARIVKAWPRAQTEKP